MLVYLYKRINGEVTQIRLWLEQPALTEQSTN